MSAPIEHGIVGSAAPERVYDVGNEMDPALRQQPGSVPNPSTQEELR